jgi:pimeloyl-ACP methyl ester carboxylesterase
MTERLYSRRRVLGSTGVALSATLFAGCSSSDDGGSGTGTGDSPTTGSRETTARPTTTETAETGRPTDSETGPPATTRASTASAVESTASSTSSGPRTVTFPAAGGTEITGTLYGSGGCGVVFVPQVNLDRGSWQPQASALADRGYVALAVDENPDARAGSVLGAVDYLRTDVGVDTLVLVGASTGGEAVVRATARADDGAVDGLVALSAAGGASVAGDLQGRSLFVASSGDEQRFVATARKLHEGAPDPTALELYDGSAHGQGLFDSAHAEDLRSRLYGLVDDVCGDGA